MAAKSTADKLLERFKVRVVKAEPDSRLSIAGERFIGPGQEGHDGSEDTYAIIPAHCVDDLQANNKQYIFGEPFIPGEEEPQKKK